MNFICEYCGSIKDGNQVQIGQKVYLKKYGKYYDRIIKVCSVCHGKLNTELKTYNDGLETEKELDLYSIRKSKWSPKDWKKENDIQMQIQLNHLIKNKNDDKMYKVVQGKNKQIINKILNRKKD